MPPPNDGSKQILLDMKSSLDALKAASAGKADAATVQKLQQQVDALDISLAQKHYGGVQAPPLIEHLKSNEDVAKLLRDRRGSATITFDAKQANQILQRKANLLESGQGFQTTGVMQLDRDTGITAEARQALTLRDVLTSRPTTLGAIDFVRVTTPMAIASPAAEASAKAENAVNFTAYSERIKVLSTWLPASRQILEDFSELTGFINSSLSYYVRQAEETEFLSGDNSGEHMNGLIHQASAFNTALLPSAAKGWTKIDILATAIRQLAIARELPATFAFLSPNDWWDIQLTKNSLGDYLIGSPQSVSRPSLFGLNIIPTTSMAAGTFLVGSGDPAAVEIRDRLELIVELSTSHASFFTQNLVAIRCEERTAIVVKRPASFIYGGSFVTSP
jgi:HK97 family phage major capsid protein